MVRPLLPSDLHVDMQTVIIDHHAYALKLAMKSLGVLAKNRAYSESSQLPQPPLPATPSDSPTRRRQISEHLQEDYNIDIEEIRELLCILLLLTYPTGTPVNEVVQDFEKAIRRPELWDLQESQDFDQFCAILADGIQTLAELTVST